MFVNFAYSDALDLAIMMTLKLLLKHNYDAIDTAWAYFPWFILYAEHRVNPYISYTTGQILNWWI